MEATLYGRICTLSPDEVRSRIRVSNEQSAKRAAKYVNGEHRAISYDYELVECQCNERCWCKRNACNGHYRLREIAFEAFLETYLTLWIPKNSRQNVRAAVLDGRSFNGRQKAAVDPLRRLREKWWVVMSEVRGYGNCGLCDQPVPLVHALMKNLYEAKMWSQLFYDSIVPFDSESKKAIKRSGYSDPAKDFLKMNRELFGDLKKLSDTHDLGVRGLRQLDSPGEVDPRLPGLAHGQPLSRVIDKIFYRP